MSELFVSYSHKDRAPVGQIVNGLKACGYQVWWDERLRRGHSDFSLEIEAALESAGCAVVAWSRLARASIWVRAEATVARESGKLVQLTLDGERPPLPFNVIDLLDMANWQGDTTEAKFQSLQKAVKDVVEAEAPAPFTPASAAPRSNLSAVLTDALNQVSLAGIRYPVLAGITSLALLICSGLLFALTSRGAISAETLGIALRALAALSAVALGSVLLRIVQAYRADKQ